MTKQLNCLITTENGFVFDTYYRSGCQDKNDEPINIITKVRLHGYELALGQLRECLVWNELTAAVKNNAYNTWDEYWEKKTKKEPVY